jgi:hypothetical protein
MNHDVNLRRTCLRLILSHVAYSTGAWFVPIISGPLCSLLVYDTIGRVFRCYGVQISKKHTYVRYVGGKI